MSDVTLEAIEKLLDLKFEEKLEPRIHVLEQKMAAGFESVETRLERMEHELLAGNERFRRLEAQDKEIIDYLVEEQGATRTEITVED